MIGWLGKCNELFLEHQADALASVELDEVLVAQYKALVSEAFSASTQLLRFLVARNCALRERDFKWPRRAILPKNHFLQPREGRGQGVPREAQAQVDRTVTGGRQARSGVRQGAIASGAVPNHPRPSGRSSPDP